MESVIKTVQLEAHMDLNLFEICFQRITVETLGKTKKKGKLQEFLLILEREKEQERRVLYNYNKTNI